MILEEILGKLYNELGTPDLFSFEYDEKGKRFHVLFNDRLVGHECAQAIIEACASYIEKMTDDEARKINNSIDKFESIQEARRDKAWEAELSAREIGCVYLCKSGITPHTKIGFSKNPRAREGTLLADDPQLKMFAIFENKTMNDERWLHAKFKDKRVRGEWFSLSEEDISKIRTVMSDSLL